MPTSSDAHDAIVVENLAKRYVLGGVKELGYKTLRDTLSSVFRRGEPGMQRETIWALHDVSFRVQRGEAIGIIGRNGAGKSTLLKILSRITEPTRGRALLHGRPGSLLEVGTGFHPELTGRENIFLNGAILGMTRAEITRKLDDIVAFAEIPQFLDTPVKRYSSGMYVRLAFAVAAHLETEILIVDEVLAVGDAQFQRKCLEKMQDVGRRGRTVLFVSHNLAAITRLCPRAILLETGRIVADGRSHEVVRRYLHSDTGSTASRRWEENEAPSNGIVRLRSVRIIDDAGALADRLDIRSPATVEVEWDNFVDDRTFTTALQFMNEEGVIAFVTQDLDPEWRGKRRPRGAYATSVTIPGNFFSEGNYTVNVSISTIESAQDHVIEREAIAFYVVDSYSGDSARGDYGGEVPGLIRPMFPWKNVRR